MSLNPAARPSEYGRNWNALVPRDAVKRILGEKHVNTPWEAIETEFTVRMDKNLGYTPAIRRQTIAFARMHWIKLIGLHRSVTQGLF